MNRVFRIGAAARVPDGTLVSPLVGAGDLDALTLAVGDIEPGRRSAIHVHPLLTQITLVMTGSLEVVMKDPAAGAPYTLPLAPGEAAVTEPGTFFQLHNGGGHPCRVLYLCSPGFMADEAYSDAVVLGHDWAALERDGWRLPAPMAAGRRAARRRAKP